MYLSTAAVAGCIGRCGLCVR